MTTDQPSVEDARADLSEALAKYDAEIERTKTSSSRDLGPAIALLAGAALANAVREALAASRAVPSDQSREISHIGRSFSDTRLEDDCPCPKGPCGLAIFDGTEHGCDQHDLGTAQTIRQMHSAADCPAASTAPGEDAEASIRLFPICGPCVRAEGSECHTPGCALYLHAVPDHPLHEELGHDQPVVPSDHTATTEDAAQRVLDRALVAIGEDHAVTPPDRRFLVEALADAGLLATAPSTATTEDAARVLAQWWEEKPWHRKPFDERTPAEQADLLRVAQALASAGLLATARPDTTATAEWGVRAPMTGTSAVRMGNEQEARRAVAASPVLTVVRREVTAWTEADRG